MAVRSVVFVAFLIILKAEQDLAENATSNSQIIEMAEKKIRLDADTCSLKISMIDFEACAPPTPASTTVMPEEEEEDLDGPDDEDQPVIFKSPKRPADSCLRVKSYQEAQKLSLDTDWFYVYPNDTFKVNCNFKEKEMCLIFDDDLNNSRTYETKNVTESYWLSSIDFNVTSFYNVNYNQIKWLQAQAKTSVRQTIRFNCKNIKLLPDDDAKSLQLLSWNGNVVDFKSTHTNPVHYEILTDNCKHSEEKPTEELFSDIKLKFIPNDSLPIIDFYVRNIKASSTDPQVVRLRPMEFCVDYE